jgi:hypothetical protein
MAPGSLDPIFLRYQFFVALDTSAVKRSQFSVPFSVAIVGMLPLMFSCHKRPIDYRNQYCGNYHFDYDAVKPIPPIVNSTLQKYDTTHEEVVGRVYYENRLPLDVIMIEFSKEVSFRVNLSKDGKIMASCAGRGQFRDKNHLDFRTCMSTSASPSGTVAYIIIGSR